jgi:hypothetical protein
MEMHKGYRCIVANGLLTALYFFALAPNPASDTWLGVT